MAGSVVERQGRDELELAARRHMALSEARIAAPWPRSTNSRPAASTPAASPMSMRCVRRPSAPRRSKSFRSSRPTAARLCTDVGNQRDQRKVISSEPLVGGQPRCWRCAVSAAPDQWVRIRRPGVGRGNGLAALIPAALFVPQVSTAGGPMNFRARMLTAGGAMIAEAGRRLAGRAMTIAGGRFVVRAAFRSSNHLGVAACVCRQPRRSARARVVASGLLPSLFWRCRSCCRGASATIRSPRSSGRSRPASSCRTSSRSSTSVRPAARRRGAGPLAQAGRHRRAAGRFIPLAESSGLIIEMTAS